MTYSLENCQSYNCILHHVFQQNRVKDIQQDWWWSIVNFVKTLNSMSVFGTGNKKIYAEKIEM